MLEQIKSREKYLAFDPIVEPIKTLKELNAINLQHTQQLLESEQNLQEVDELLLGYNEIVERLSEHLKYLHAQQK